MAAVELPHQPRPALGQLAPILGHPGLLRIAIPEQDQQLARGETGAGICALGPPGEAPLGETLRTQPEALAVIAQDFEGGARAVAEDIEGAAEGIVAEEPAADGGQPINPLAKIDGLRSYKDAALRGQLEHPGVSKKVRTRVATGHCGSYVWIRSRVPSGRWSSSSVPAGGVGCTGVAVTSTKRKAMEAGAGCAA